MNKIRYNQSPMHASQMSLTIGGLIFSFLLVGSMSQQVTTPDGPIQGVSETTVSGKKYSAFYSIRYGKPPTGSRRFLAAEPVDSWTETYDAATEKSNICFQLYNDDDQQTEDCLFLSVFTPQTSTSSNITYPVFFNIHGGGFYGGSGTLASGISPKYLLEEDVIVVIFNYRLTALGFLSTGNEVIPGNAGLTDQVLALKWIQRNIAAFGGDPQRVTIAGQSAGAKSVGYLILSPLATGLFSAGIMESGTVLSPGGFQRNHTNIAFKLGSFVDAQFNSSRDSKKLLEVLQDVDAKTVNAAGTSFANWAAQQTTRYERDQGTQGYYFTPAIDSASSNPVLPELQYEALINGNFNKVPIFVGVTSEEGLMDAPYNDVTHLKAFHDVHSLLNPQDMNISGEDDWAEVGDLIYNIYSPNGSLVDNPLGIIQYYTDQEYARGSIKHAELQSVFTDVFYYQFSYTGKLGGGNQGYPGSGNVSHVGEGSYIYFGKSLADYPETDQLISKRLVKIWTNFVKYHNPTPEKDELLQNITWPKVASEEFQFVNIGNYEETDLIVTAGRPKAPKMAFWDTVYEEYGKRPFDTY
ncbi:juvenile hormone esterase [Dendroctonus ponderosae]|nr:juvenile hormone esterase [Dendroctonus ponderosae]KAH1022158.1 hypothetical protein HUJ04_011594 [Dendroctonus ponderosae]KAH1028742.1 hypothetical protein HUJ05_002072 [Dendroctonus ponderosae]